jgi:hypothetical protein
VAPHGDRFMHFNTSYGVLLTRTEGKTNEDKGVSYTIYNVSMCESNVASHTEVKKISDFELESFYSEEL